MKHAMEELRDVGGIGGSLFNQNKEGGPHRTGGIWATSCKEPSVRTSEKAKVGKSLVCLGAASNLSGWDSASKGRRVNGLHEAQETPGAQVMSELF